MNKITPSARSMKSAWDVCQRTRHPHAAEADILVLALLYGAGLGAARAVTTIDDGAEAAHVQTARLFAALQIKLRREPDCLMRITPGAFSLLLSSLPIPWAKALKACHEPVAATPMALRSRLGAGNRITTRHHAKLPSLADMEAVGSA